MKMHFSSGSIASAPHVLACTTTQPLPPHGDDLPQGGLDTHLGPQHCLPFDNRGKISGERPAITHQPPLSLHFFWLADVPCSILAHTEQVFLLTSFLLKHLHFNTLQNKEGRLWTWVGCITPCESNQE